MICALQVRDFRLNLLLGGSRRGQVSRLALVIQFLENFSRFLQVLAFALVRIVCKATLAAKRAFLHDGGKEFLRFRRRRDIHGDRRSLVRDTTGTRIVRDGLHHIFRLDTTNLPGGHAHYRGKNEFF